MQPPGLIALFGSGETSASGRRAHQMVLERLGRPVDVAVLATPAGFEPNALRVVEKIKQFLETSLAEFRPSVALVEARRADGQGGTNDATALAPLLQANYLFAGPGSPSYAVRHLCRSLALGYMRSRWEAGACLGAASAAAIALGRCALPVYEIFKAGHDPYWLEGLDLLGAVGMPLAIVPHWNNREGGQEYDSSRCFMGQARFDRLLDSLPPGTGVLGIDEHTACVLDFEADAARVVGAGAVTFLRGREAVSFADRASFRLDLLRV